MLCLASDVYNYLYIFNCLNVQIASSPQTQKENPIRVQLKYSKEYIIKEQKNINVKRWIKWYKLKFCLVFVFLFRLYFFTFGGLVLDP